MTGLPANLNSVASVSSSADVNASAGAVLAPASTSVDATNSDPDASSRVPETAADTSVSPLLSFEAEVAALEVEWLRAGIIMNSMAFRVIAASDNISKSVSVTE